MPYYTDRRSMPPCPDPDRYILVETKEGFCWRRRRGEVKPARLNAKMEANRQMLSRCSPAAQRLLAALAPYTLELDRRRIQSRFTALFMEGYSNGRFSYTPCLGQELQPEYPLGALLKSPVTVTQPGYSVAVQVPIRPAAVHRHTNLVSDFYLEAILVSGDPFSGAPLKVESAQSPLYPYEALPNTTCTLQLPIDGKPWILLLKFCSLEGNELAVHPKHYAMKVIEVGG